MASTCAPISDSVVRKIQLLLNLASRPEGNEVEAAAAQARAMEILAQYNLDLATVQDKVVAGGTAAIAAEAKRDYARSDRSAMYKWQQTLVRTVTEANFCRYWVEEVRTERYGRSMLAKRHKVLGRLVNTTATMVMVDYLLEAIERCIPYTGRERLSSAGVMWREGCAERLCERITAKAEAMRKADYATQGEAAYSTAIQVADLARKEAAGNYDFLNGEGAWARKLAREAESEKYWTPEACALRKAAREAELAAARALESTEQRIEREKREAKEAKRAERASERYARSYYAREDREAARRSSAAYRAGQRQGSEIGLDSQVGAGSKSKELQ
jgi:hypothetical protein